MNSPFKLHQTNRQHVYVLQSHRDLMLKTHPQLDVHPDNNGDMALQSITQQYHLPHRPVFMKQVHGAKSIRLNSIPNTHFWQAADACFTRHKDIICAVMTADCLPVLITDTQASFVAAVHCGWRSLYQGILTQLMDRIQPVYPLKLWFGPAICQNHYQVDNAFKDHYLQAHPDAAQAFTEVVDNHCHADLKMMAKVQLQHHDIDLIEDASICTYQHDSYYSWRQNKTSQRQASMIWIHNSG